MQTASSNLKKSAFGLGAGLAFGLTVASASLSLHPHFSARMAQASELASKMPTMDEALAADAPLSNGETLREPQADQLTLYRRRVADFRKIEDRFFGVHAQHRFTALRRATIVARGRNDLDCLSQAIYYEARSEPALGQAAVAQVVMNRAHDPRYPKSVCGVVYQGANHRGCQFSFACDGSMSQGRPDVASWARARAVAAKALSGSVVDAVASSLNYHANYVSPSWAQRLLRVAEIGRHIFYRAVAGVMPPGASPVPRAFSAPRVEVSTSGTVDINPRTEAASVGSPAT